MLHNKHDVLVRRTGTTHYASLELLPWCGSERRCRRGCLGRVRAAEPALVDETDDAADHQRADDATEERAGQGSRGCPVTTYGKQSCKEGRNVKWTA